MIAAIHESVPFLLNRTAKLYNSLRGNNKRFEKVYEHISNYYLKCQKDPVKLLSCSYYIFIKKLVEVQTREFSVCPRDILSAEWFPHLEYSSPFFVTAPVMIKGSNRIEREIECFGRQPGTTPSGRILRLQF
jgi:hypothetical protein